MQVEMTAEAVTNRMIALDQLWELAVALKSSKIEDDIRSEGGERNSSDEVNKKTVE